ncbi:MAG: zf-TFIIB domain-containing protein [Candidatus Thorarchaeota archaeon]
MNMNLIRTCPACGYSFRPFDSQKKEKIKRCPMCGYKFIEPDILPEKLKDFNNKYI